MKSHRLYEIPFVGLKNGVHRFEYQIEDKFFSEGIQPDFTDCHLQVRLILDKKIGFFLFKFEITGSVTVNCDRCGDPFTLAIWDEFDHVVKLVDDPKVMEVDDSPDVSYISRTDSHLDVSSWIYEFILLSIPMQRIHPEEGPNHRGCNPAVLGMLDKMKEPEKRSANPIWKGLDKFRKHI
jgi:uncharacterized metal-binding protein YceD (DUF177 family)